MPVVDPDDFVGPVVCPLFVEHLAHRRRARTVPLVPQVPSMVTRPDVAALTTRVIRSCVVAAELSEKSPYGTQRSVSELIDDLIVTVDRSSPTPTRDLREVVLLSLSDQLSQTLDEELERSCAVLAGICGHSPELLHSRPVLRAILQRGLKRRSGGAQTVRLCNEIISLLTVRDGYSVPALAHSMTDVWEKPLAHAGYDAVVAQHAHLGDVSALAWSVIGFESQRHINLVWHQANKLERLFPDRDAADMLALGWMGLRTALRLYDPTLGFSFSTYACTRITGSIRDGVRAENPVPKRLGTFGRKVAAAEEALAHSLGRAPTLDEVAAHLGVTLDELRIMPRLQAAASIEELEEYANERGGPSAWLVDDTDPADLTVSALRRDAVEEALSRLDPQDAAAVRLLVMEGLRPAEAQSITGEAPRRLRARRERALAVLRDELDGWHDGRHD